ncbi:M48 family metallopeptidase [Periweissella cryptocerci]|nr:M48 family metallopeptidase [Periweissella cryptocerci]
MGFLDDAKNLGKSVKDQVGVKVEEKMDAKNDDATPVVPVIRIENAHDFCHNSDKQALEALQKVPLIDTVMKKMDKYWSSHMLKMNNLASNIKLGPNQLPEIYNLLPPICDYFGIEEPDFYITLDPNPNAFAQGVDQFSITVTSGLLEMCSAEELTPVIAHEVGHIVCNHMMYHQMGLYIASVGASLGGASQLALAGLESAYNYWSRCSEFSADRAAALYLKDAAPVVNMMVKLSGGSKVFGEINVQEYFNQAVEYERLKTAEVRSKVAHYAETLMTDHPLNAVRAFEIEKWCQTDEFKQLIAKGNLKTEVVREHIFCTDCGAKNVNESKFCSGCGKNLEVA